MATPDERRPRLLVIDDEPSVLRLVDAALADTYDLVVASDGEQGLRLALTSPPDLILTDVNMPRMSGQEMLRRLQQERSLEDVPVIVLTGQRDEDLRVELLKNGAQDFLNKPFSTPELRVRIANLLRIRHARHLLQQELQSRERDIGALVAEVSARREALQSALEMTKLAHARAEKANQAKGAFLAMVSHELRTPLTVLRMAVDIWERRLKAGPGVAASATGLPRVAGALERLTSIVDGVIDYTEIHSGRIELRPERTDLFALIAGLLSEVEARIVSKGLRIDIEVSDEAKAATIDAHIVRIILRNLISNAIKYTDAGSLQVRAFISGGVVFTVRDSGQGIDPLNGTRIFEPFESGEPVMNKTTPGIGLGLAAVRDLVALLDGTVSFTSQQGAGSTFTVTLPAAGRTAQR
ncbi:MAG TPA: hybrid sensor histidine kinase/response regulator [Polyangia bacterium]|nr:hybrid sensor histidine kinase/response regulator [Polyangia bacterium]